MNWAGVYVRIYWNRCARRQWPPTSVLEFTPQQRRKPHNVLLYWWAGRGLRLLPEGAVEICPGTCHWARPGWTYHCTQDPRQPLSVTAIHFDLANRRGRVLRLQGSQLPPERLRVSDAALVNEITRWIAEKAMDVRAGVPLAPAAQEAAGAMLRGLLMKLEQDTAGDWQAGRDSDGTAWRRLTSYIQEHLHSLTGVEQLARQMGYTRSHFSRTFRRQAGLSPQQYIINARIALAKELLRSTGLSVTEVAVRAGYRDLFRFSKQFKERTRLSPSRYRTMANRAEA